MPEKPKKPPKIIGDLSRSNLTAFLGDSITLGNGGVNFFGGAAYPTVACLNSGGVIRPYINAGVAGNRVSHMLARIYPDVINAKSPKPGKCIVLGGTNDAGITPMASFIADLGAIYDTLRANGIEPIGCTIPPRVTNTAGVAPINIAVRQLCDRRGMVCVDFHAALVDPSTGHYITGYDLGDGTHPNATGQKAMSGVIQAKLLPSYRHIPPLLCQDNTETTNLISNGLFITDANADGVADLWTPSLVSGTTTATIESGDPNILGNWQVLTTTVAGPYFILQVIPFNASSPRGWTAGDVLAFSGIINTSVESGGEAPTVRCHVTGSPGVDFTPVYQQNVDMTRGVFFMRFPIQAGATGITVQAYGNQSGVGTGVVKFAQFSLYNLTRLGLV